MANKTIHQLTPASTVTSDFEFAVYDTDSDSTKKATASQILGTEDILYADDPSTPSGEVDFTTQDTSLNPTSSVSVDLLTGSDSWSQRFVKISQMFKNIRYLLGKLGSTDISSIGDGSVTGAVSTLNSKTSLTVRNYTASVTGIAPGNSAGLNANNFGVSTPTGYTPVAAIGFSSGGASGAIDQINAAATGTARMMSIVNTSAKTHDYSASITILYVKTEMIV